MEAARFQKWAQVIVRQWYWTAYRPWYDLYRAGSGIAKEVANAIPLRTVLK